MKRTHLLVLSAIALTFSMSACRAKKDIQQVTKSTRIELPLDQSKYKTDKNFFRSVADGKSPNLATAKKIALQNAKSEMAQNVSSLMMVVSDLYTNQREIADKQAYESKFEETSRTSVSQQLSEVQVIAEEVYKEKDGAYDYWVAIEMDKSAVAEKVADRITKDEKLNLDFDRAQFLKIFNQEMAKVRDAQQ